MKKTVIDRFIIWPHPILRKVSKKVTSFDENLTQLTIDLLLVLKITKGLGISACQIEDRRSVLICQKNKKFLVMVNPLTISSYDNSSIESEGCLSLPGIYIKVSRAPGIQVTYQDLEEIQHTQYFEGQEARIVQHELDHLSGKTILSYLSKLKRDMLTSKMKKVKKRLEKSEKENAGAKKRLFKNMSKMGS